MALKIGIDVGNYDTKTQNSTTPSGYKAQKVQPRISDEWIFYKGQYYVPTEERFPYSMDKTENGHALILSLFGIAKEILHVVNSTYESKTVDKQELINRYHNVSLGIGLPPGHFDNLAKKTLDYYNSIFADEVKFVYSGYDFVINVKRIKIFPQDFMAVFKNPQSKIEKEYDKYYVIGIGGYTVDIVLIKDGKVDASSCRSLPLGTTVMYDEIIKDVLKEGESISRDGIERVLMGKKQILPEKIVSLIKESAQTHADNVIDACVTANVKFSEAPVVYFGGGCLLLKEYLKNNPIVKVYEFIDNVNANAEHYAKFIKD